MPLSIPLRSEIPPASGNGDARSQTNEGGWLIAELSMAALQFPHPEAHSAAAAGAFSSERSRVVSVRDAVDAQRLAASPVAHSDEQFHQFAKSVNDVFWIYEPQSARFVYVSPAYEREWMRSAAALYADAQEWFSPVHRDDRELLQDAFGQLARCDSFALEYRATLPSGEERWIAERTVPLANPADQTPRIVGVSQDVTLRKKAHLELLRSDRRKDEFFATLAHELRGPLAPIRSAAALLARQHADGPAVAQRAVGIIERQVNHLIRLIGDLSDISRIKHGKVQLHSQVMRLEEVIGAAVDSRRELAEAGGMHLRFQLPECDVWVMGDSDRLTQVFCNLLDNAIKFSAADGTIDVSIRMNESGRQVAVSVRDEGAGIAADRVDSVFDLFMQEERSLAKSNGGLGIGLTIVRRLTELHGGSVSVRSDGIGKGSEFLVTLPTARAPQPNGRDTSPPRGTRVTVGAFFASAQDDDTPAIFS